MAGERGVRPVGIAGSLAIVCRARLCWLEQGAT
jgi:hypothetical protein